MTYRAKGRRANFAVFYHYQSGRLPGDSSQRCRPRTIARIAAGNSGRCSVNLHMRHDPEGDPSRWVTTELRRFDLAEAGRRIAGECNLPYVEVKRGQDIDGIYKSRVDLASGRFAVIDNGRRIALVPWQPVLERNLGRTVSGVMRSETVFRTLGRQRGRPSI